MLGKKKPPRCCRSRGDDTATLGVTMQFDDTVLGNLFTLYWDRVVVPGDPDACWGWTGPLDIRGYGHISVQVNKRQVPFVASRVAYLFHNTVEPSQCVLHHCDNRPCTNPRHIYDGSRAQNNRDRDARGRTVVPRISGERHWNSKMTVALVREIRALFEDGVPVAEITRDYAHLGISRQAISDIVFGRTWQHVT
jgi:hypothetical protein